MSKEGYDGCVFADLERARERIRQLEAQVDMSARGHENWQLYAETLEGALTLLAQKWKRDADRADSYGDNRALQVLNDVVAELAEVIRRASKQRSGVR